MSTIVILCALVFSAASASGFLIACIFRLAAQCDEIDERIKRELYDSPQPPQPAPESTPEALPPHTQTR